MAKNIRGLSENQEQRASKLVRDTRTFGQRFSDFIKQSKTNAALLLVLAGCCIFLPSGADVFLILGIIAFIICITAKFSLPFRMPLSSHDLDYNDLNPGTGKPMQASGICFFGNEQGNNKELWFNNSDMRTHVLIFGSTGSGKTVLLTSIVSNALIQGSGFIYVDGKGDNSLFANIFSLCRTMGREDDLLLINFMTGARDIIGAQKTRISNTMNPFARGSSSMLTNLVVSMMSDSGNSGDGDMWKGRAISFVEALMKILVYMRDQGEILLDANSIRLYFNLPKLEQMAVDKKFPVSNDRSVDISHAPDVVIEPLFNYLQTLPGYNTANKGKQSGEVWEQHGFITMQLTRTFSSLADTYGHIIRHNLAEVDMKDIVLNRRILVVLLPALEKSPEELANLGKIIVASIKGMMASGLGEEVEGTYRDVIERKPTNSPTPFLCVLDEYGYYAVPGFAVVPAQARSLGFSAIFAGQDLPAFQKASKEEAASIGANTNIKICMKLEDPVETFEFFQKTAGQAYVTRTGGFQTDSNSISNTYTDNKSAQIEKQDRIELADLKDQDLGEMHMFFKSRIIRAKGFYANPQPAKKMKLNQFLKVEEPDDVLLASLTERFKKLESVLQNPEILNQDLPLDEDLATLKYNIANSNERGITGAINGIKSIFQQEIQEENELLLQEDEVEPDFKGMDILTLEPKSPESVVSFDPLDFMSFSAMLSPLLNKRDTKRNIERIERLSGKTKSEASSIADKIISDLRTSTHYPPSEINPQEPSETIATIKELVRTWRGSDDSQSSSGLFPPDELPPL